MNGKKKLTTDKKAIVTDDTGLTPGTPCHKIALRLQSKREKTPLKQDNENVLGYINKCKQKLPLPFLTEYTLFRLSKKTCPCGPFILNHPLTQPARPAPGRAPGFANTVLIPGGCFSHVPSLPPHPISSPS